MSQVVGLQSRAAGGHYEAARSLLAGERTVVPDRPAVGGFAPERRKCELDQVLPARGTWRGWRRLDVGTTCAMARFIKDDVTPHSTERDLPEDPEAVAERLRC